MSNLEKETSKEEKTKYSYWFYCLKCRKASDIPLAINPRGFQLPTISELQDSLIDKMYKDYPNDDLPKGEDGYDDETGYVIECSYKDCTDSFLDETFSENMTYFDEVNLFAVETLERYNAPEKIIKYFRELKPKKDYVYVPFDRFLKEPVFETGDKDCLTDDDKLNWEVIHKYITPYKD